MKDWALVVVPDGGFVVLLSERQMTEAQVVAFKQNVPGALRDRVLVAAGFTAPASGARCCCTDRVGPHKDRAVEKVNMWGFA